MGKGLLIIVGGVMISATILSQSGQEASIKTREGLSSYEYQILARNAAESGYNEGLSSIERAFMDASSNLTGTMSDGTYNVAIAKHEYGKLGLGSTGNSGHATHQIDADVIFEVPIEAAALLSSDSVQVTITGSSTVISGTDVRAPGVTGSTTALGFLSPISGILTNSGGDAHVLGLLETATTDDQVLGLGGPGSVSGGFDPTFYEDLYDEVMAQSGQAYYQEYFGPTTLTLVTGSFGTPANPKLVVVHGDVTLTGAGTGYGMLLINDGNLTVASASAQWEGLVFARNQSGLLVDLSSGGAIYGGLMAFEYDAGTTVEECTPDFEVSGDATLVNEAFRVKVEVLGAAISMGAGGYDMPVTAKIRIGDQTFEPWGDYDQALEGNVNRDGTFVFEPDQTFPPGDIRIDAQSWKKKSGGYYTYQWRYRRGRWRLVSVYHEYDGSSEDHWRVHMQKNSDVTDNQLEVLVDGSPVPDIGGFAGQSSAADFVADYIDGTEMRLDENQSIYLFELGVNSPGSSAHDYQDLVVLVTMVPADVSSCVTAGGGGAPVLDLRLGNSAQIRYSAEAIAKLGQHLATLEDRTEVVVASQRASR